MQQRKLSNTAAQALFCLKMLKAHGLDQISVFSVCYATVLSRILYAAPAWWGFANSADRAKLQAVLDRARRWGYYKSTAPSVEAVCEARERKLFAEILSEPSHVLHHLLPPDKTHLHDLRPRAHHRMLPDKTNSLVNKNFLTRMLYSSLTQSH